MSPLSSLAGVHNALCFRGWQAYPNTTDWVAALLIALLGISTALKQEFHSTLVELKYGTTSRGISYHNQGIWSQIRQLMSPS